MKNDTLTGVVLLNLGGPEQPRDIEPFLNNLFSDRQIIRLGPPSLQKFLARLIARRRAPKSRETYDRIGGSSPLKQITDQQAAALERSLADDGSYMVRTCMRYWHPFAHEVLPEMQQKGVHELILLPLYPQYSEATSGSSLADLESTANRLDLGIPIHTVRSWPAQPDYIAALVERIEEAKTQFHGEPVQILYSAHSLPQRLIDKGDPYVQELQETIEAIEEQTEQRGILCYQSQSGPVKWLGPPTGATIRELAARGRVNFLVVPISFVSDHVETLVELEMDYRAIAEKLGTRYIVTKGLNITPKFIAGLRSLVLEAQTQGS